MAVLVVVPSYDGKVEAGLLASLLVEAVRANPPIAFASQKISAICNCFNQLWCIGLNNRKQFTHLLMIHSDIVPMTEGFIGTMVSEMEQTRAGVVSALVPIKSAHGATSTGLAPVDCLRGFSYAGREWARRRLTMREADALPETFGRDDLVALFGSDDGVLMFNTGLMLVDLRQDWVEDVHFEFHDTIYRGEDGQFRADFEPEDWYFSRVAHSLGVRAVVTRKVKLAHVGQSAFENQGAWGEWTRDGG